jgi:CO/xanthine dehydrogenase Mo-binding subunit
LDAEAEAGAADGPPGGIPEGADVTVGQSVRRIDALGKVTGETLYPGDIYPEGALAMKILFAGRPHAIVRRIDTEEAERVPGVVAVLTARDVPVNEYGLIMPDQPVLCGPVHQAGPDRVGSSAQLALVVAEDEATAAKALRRIVVDFEDLPAITDVESALAAGATLLHPERDSNIFCHYRIRKGDAEARPGGCRRFAELSRRCRNMRACAV